MNYIGYFRSIDNLLYQVQIVKDENQPAKEIILAGEEPFIVQYNTCNTLFDPIRTSVATIKIVHNDYMEDILPSKARETRVTLTIKGEGYDADDSIVWDGYLTPKVYNQGYTDEYEIIELEAADCLSVTQYIPYENDTAIGIKSFKDIIVNIVNKTNIQNICWQLSREIKSKTLYPDKIFVSEANFFSDDTDEPWSSYEVLEEICKYMGFTAIVKFQDLYFIDYTSFVENDAYDYVQYRITDNFRKEWLIYAGGTINVTEEDLRGTGQSISFEPIYNKFVVKDSFYTSEDFISNIFDDKSLKNRGGEFYSSFQLDVPPPRDPSDPDSHRLPNAPTYPKGSTWFQQKYVNDADDTKYVYWHRLYDHEDFESVYRDFNLNEIQPEEHLLNDPNTTRNFIGGTICDLGRVRKEYFNEETWQTIVTNKVDWDRYLLIHQHRTGQGWSGRNDFVGKQDKMTIFRLKPGSRGKCLMSDDSFIIINYKLLFTKYRFRNYINPDWTKDIGKMSGWLEGSIGQAPGYLTFKLGIGGKYWDGSRWHDEPVTFNIYCTREDEDEYAYFMEEKEVLNNVGWELNIDEEGYKIPLGSVDTAGEIDFAIYLPKLQLLTDFDGLHPFTYNNYCWVKDLSIKTANSGQDKEVEEADVVYENVVDEANVSEMSDIELKITTAVPNQKPSFSNAIYYDANKEKHLLLETMGDNILNQVMTPEENIITRYYKQYSTPTKRLSYTIHAFGGPVNVFKGVDVEDKHTKYVQMGSEINYKMDSQIIDLIELK
jgi:hypothetical protein